jgi:hypothetical protein
MYGGHLFRPPYSFLERISEWWDPRKVLSIFTYNRYERLESVKNKWIQYRGTAQISRHAAALRKIEHGMNPEGLRRCGDDYIEAEIAAWLE